MRNNSFINIFRPKSSKVQHYWIETHVGFFGPFKSRRQAGRALYAAHILIRLWNKHHDRQAKYPNQPVTMPHAKSNECIHTLAQMISKDSKPSRKVRHLSYIRVAAIEDMIWADQNCGYI